MILARYDLETAMRMRFLATFMVLSVFAIGCAAAAPLIDCGKTDNSSVLEAACTDRGIVELDKEVAAAFDAAIATATDPLTATLLAGENNRRQAVLDSVNQGVFSKSELAPSLSFLQQSLQRDVKLLKAIARPQPNDGVAGDWANASGTLNLMPQGLKGYHLSIKRSRIQNHFDKIQDETVNNVVSCDIAVDLRAGPDSWFIAGVNDKSHGPTKLTRQGISLRLFVGDAERSQGDGSCGDHDAATGTYFRVVAEPDRAVIATAKEPERPSFACTKDAGSIEIEICSDPELARLDRALAKAYLRALAQLDPETVKLFKVDQRAWIKIRASDYDYYLSPEYYKQDTMADNFGAGLETLAEETTARIGMLNLIEGQRAGFVGDWMSDGSFVHISRDSDGKFSLIGGIRGRDSKPMYCAYEARPVVDHGILSAPSQEDTPAVRSDGRTLLIAADLGKMTVDGRLVGDQTANYCIRGQTPTDRLFPIKGDNQERLKSVQSDLER